MSKLLLITVLVTSIVAGFYFYMKNEVTQDHIKEEQPIDSAEANIDLAKKLTLHHLINATEEELKQYGIALVNLVVSRDLYRTKDIDENAYFRTLEEWTNKIKNETEKYLPRYRTKHRFEFTENQYRVMMIATVLGQDLGLDYTKDLKTQQTSPLEVFYKDASDIFLFGCFAKKEGTCASMPVLITTLARMLDLPVFLVSSKGHLLARFVSKEETFNIEFSGAGGIKFHPDEFYKTWPRKMTKEDLKMDAFLKPMSPKEELATFLDLRATVLMAHQKRRTAQMTWAFAQEKNPSYFPHRMALEASIQEDWKKKGIPFEIEDPKPKLPTVP